MKFAAAVVAYLISAFALSDAFAQEPACQLVRAQGASFVLNCGTQLNAFRLVLLETKLGSSGMRRETLGDMEGRFSFLCPMEPICGHEPVIGGFFISAEQWNKSSKDEQAIYQASMRGVPQPQVSPATCSMFDVVVGGMPGRGTCLGVKGGNIVIIVAADDRVGLLLHFQNDRSASELRDQVIEIMPRFKIERATGDSALLEWFR